MGNIYEVPAGEIVEDVNKQISKEEQDLLKAAEWPLQIGWLEYRICHLGEAEIEMLAQKIAEHEPSHIRREYILHGPLQVKKEAVIADTIDPDGSLAQNIGIERQWFRGEVEKNPLDERFVKALSLMGSNEKEQAYETLDAYFRESIQKH